MSNIVVWFDLPVTDLDRAIDFYSKVVSCRMAGVSFRNPYADALFRGDCRLFAMVSNHQEQGFLRLENTRRK